MLEEVSIFVLIVIIETVLSAIWDSTYFKIGIPIYMKRYPFEGTAPNPVSEIILNKAFIKSDRPSMVFRQIGAEEYAFREKLIQFSLFTYTPLMHGKLKIDETSGRIKVTGLMNLWFMVFVLSIALTFLDDLSFLSLIAVVSGMLYFFQKIKYDKVGQFVYEWNSRCWAKPQSA